MTSTPFATQAGTARYADRFRTQLPDHFRARYGLWMSSIGLGTYLGNNDAGTSQGYQQSIAEAVRGGCNVIDTAINYRMMQSERDVGAALRELFASGDAARDELIVCTKGGLIAHDGSGDEAFVTDRQADLQARFFDTGLAEPTDIAGGIHCMTPAYLSNQIDTSLANLGLDGIDVYYIHNPEVQLDYVTPDAFKTRMRAAFECLEAEVARQRIRFYGVATWDGLRASESDPAYLPLHWLVDLAREVGGPRHHFRFVQFPYSLSMIEALTERNQYAEREGADGAVDRVHLQLLAACVQHGMVAVGSAGLGQTAAFDAIPQRLRERMEPHLPALFPTDAHLALQFNRSTPGLTTSLVGMSSPFHVTENLAVAQIAPMPASTFWRTFRLPGASANDGA